MSGRNSSRSSRRQADDDLDGPGDGEEEEEEAERSSSSSQSDDKILYALIARGQTSLVDYSVREGNHVLLAQQILGKAKVDQDHKRSFPDKSGRYQFHYMLKDGITYLCFATSDKKTAVCFSFLDEIRLRFRGTYEEDLIAKAMAYSTSFLDFKRVLKEEMVRFGNIEFADQKAAIVSRKIDGVRNTMKDNIDKLWERDSQIEDLLEKTEVLDTESTRLQVNSKKLATKFWWKNFKLWVIIIVVTLVLAWLILSLVCGWRFQCLKKCFHEESVITMNGRHWTLTELQQGDSGCVIPHIVHGKGVSVSTSCGGAPLRLTHDHLVQTPDGWRQAGQLTPGSVVFGTMDKSRLCTVQSVVPETQTQTYFGLNCPDSVLMSDGILVSTFGRMHTLPALWMKYASKVFGIERASSWGDHLANAYFVFVRQ